MDKEKFTAPETEIVEFETTGDPIATSTTIPVETESDGLPFIPQS